MVENNGMFSAVVAMYVILFNVCYNRMHGTAGDWLDKGPLFSPTFPTICCD